uniref:Uncharacterized protein n=1 Tax=Kalanchoe fedtschenkoi TaxID=63787 RepID=A0A7N0T022_KALFE
MSSPISFCPDTPYRPLAYPIVVEFKPGPTVSGSSAMYRVPNPVGEVLLMADLAIGMAVGVFPLTVSWK